MPAARWDTSHFSIIHLFCCRVFFLPVLTSQTLPDAEGQAILGPLNDAAVVEDHAGQHHPFSQHHRLVCRLLGKANAPRCNDRQRLISLRATCNLTFFIGLFCAAVSAWVSIHPLRGCWYHLLSVFILYVGFCRSWVKGHRRNLRFYLIIIGKIFLFFDSTGCSVPQFCISVILLSLLPMFRHYFVHFFKHFPGLHEAYMCPCVGMCEPECVCAFLCSRNIIAKLWYSLLFFHQAVQRILLTHTHFLQQNKPFGHCSATEIHGYEN